MATTTRTAQNPHAEAARHRKAAQAAQALLELQEPPLADTILFLDDKGWETLEAAAGIKPCSPQTRQLIADIYRDLAGVRARLVDPFDFPADGRTD